VRVGTAGGSNAVKLAAFKNVDGTVAIVALNGGGSAATLSVKVTGADAPASAIIAVSDNTHTCEESAATVGADGAVSGAVPARSIVTFVLTPAAAAAEDEAAEGEAAE